MRREAGEQCWEDLEELAQDRRRWREFIEALCILQGATGVDCTFISSFGLRTMLTEKRRLGL